VEKALGSQSPASLGFRAPKSSSKGANPGLTPEEAHALEIENGTHQLETLLCASIDRNFDKFELYVMRNILCVRPEDRDFVRLAHYDGLDLSAMAAADPGVAAESVNALRRRVQASRRLGAALAAEHARGEALLCELRAAVGGKAKGEGCGGSGGPAAFLRDTGDLRGVDADSPLATTAAFSLSQLQALRALSTSLRGLAPDLAPADGESAKGTGPGSGSWRRERLEYIEGATRKHLENVRGLELGPGGEVRDGEWQGEGRRLGKGEAEGVEHVVAILSGKGDEMDDS
jgi:kinetochore protein Mis12/MTW1